MFIEIVNCSLVSMQKLNICDQNKNILKTKSSKENIETLVTNSRKYHIVSPVSVILLTH